MNNPDSVPPEALWAFIANGSHGTWQYLNQSSVTVFNNLTRLTYGSANFGTIGGFGLGGYFSGYSSQKNEVSPGTTLSQVLVYNSTALRHSLGTTALGRLYFQRHHRVRRSSLCIDTGWRWPGGQTANNRTCFTDGESYLPISNMSLFDASFQYSYYRQAIGDIPSQRDRFCLVGVSAGDKTTFSESSRIVTWTTITTEIDTILQKYSCTPGGLALACTTEVHHEWHITLNAMRYMF